MARASDFTAYLKEMLASGSVYIWGKQGEFVGNMTIGQIIASETSAKNAARVLKLIGSRIDGGTPYEKIRAFDCSGLGVNYFLKNKLIKSDTTADGLYKMCTPIKLSELREGDMVFIVGKQGANHVGYCIGGDKIIEAAGRDLGVVCRDRSANNWTHAGRPPFWKYVLPRTLYYTSPMMIGDDVKQVQIALNSKGYSCGTIDGEFGQKTMNAVMKYQEENLKVLSKNLGKVNKKTAESLGFEVGF